MNCPGCHVENKTGARFCAKCGTTLMNATPPVTRACNACGNDCKADARFCPKCGTSFAQVAGLTATVAEPLVVPAVSAAAPVPPSAQSASGSPVADAPMTPDEAVVASAPAVPVSVDALPPEPVMQQPTPPAKPFPVGVIAAVAVLVVVIAGGAFYALRGGDQSSSAGQVNPNPAPVAPTPVIATPAPAPQVAAPAPPSAEPLIALPQPEPAAVIAPEPADTVVAKPAPASHPRPRTPKSEPVAARAPAVDDGVMSAAITGALDDGAKCMSQKKFDCAIASANTVLRLAPGNRSAQDMKRRAREAQDRALSQIEIQ